MQRPIPLRPDYSAVRPTGVPFIRGVAAIAKAQAQKSHIGDVIRNDWNDSKELHTFTRAAVTTTGTDTTPAFVGTQVADLVDVLGPISALAGLRRAGISLSFDQEAMRAGFIMVPDIVASAGNASYVQQASPIPVRQFSFDGATTLSPRKLAVICVFTREIFNHSIPNIEKLVDNVVTASIALEADLLGFDSVAEDLIRPAGLRNGISALTASTAGATIFDTMTSDIMKLVAAVAPVAGASPIVLIASPVQAYRLRLHPNIGNAFQIFASAGLAANTLIAIASNCFVSALGEVPRIEEAREATLHMSDTPAQLVTGTTPTVATPSRSLWQTDSVGLRIILDISFALRNIGGLAWMTSTLW